MKTITEFHVATLKTAHKTRQELLTAGKTAEELPAALGEALKLEGDKLNNIIAALEFVDADSKSKALDLKRVIVSTLNEKETAPAHALQKGDFYFAIEYFPPLPGQEKKQPRGGRDGDSRDSRGGRGGRDGKRGDRKGKGGPGGRDSRGGGGRPDRSAGGPLADGAPGENRRPDNRPPRDPNAPPRAPRPPRDPNAPQQARPPRDPNAPPREPRAPRPPRPPRIPIVPPVNDGLPRFSVIVRGKTDQAAASTDSSASAPASQPAQESTKSE